MAVTTHGAEVVDDRDGLRRVYAAAFGAAPYDEPPERADAFVDEQLPRHAAYDGFRCAVAREEGAVTGFAYAYAGRRGQWFSDHVVATAPPEVAAAWVGDHLEVVELAVDPAAQGRGRGAALVRALVADVPHARALLSTRPGDTPASRLYARLGWRRLCPLTPDADLWGLHLPAPRPPLA